MHRSRIAAICIDVPEEYRDAVVAFWSAALGREARAGTVMPEYSVLGDVHGHRLLIQAVGDDVARVHLDLHTDDRDAEVNRLLALGATALSAHDDWVVLRDPAGVVFCVVPVDSDDPSLDGASEWP